MIIAVIALFASVYLWFHRYWYPDTVRVSKGIAIIPYRWHGVDSHYLVPLGVVPSEWRGRPLELEGIRVDPTLPPYPCDRYHCEGRGPSSLEDLTRSLTPSDDDLILDEEVD